MKHQIVSGLDEVGRGALAGPLVAAAVVMSCFDPETIPGLKLIQTLSKAPIRDSKKLSPLQRQRLFNAIAISGCEIYLSSISVGLINQFGIGWANKQIFLNLINRVKASKFIIDGNLKLTSGSDLNSAVECIPHADATYPIVSLASIVAKVARDNLMADLHLRFPHYHWHTNKGYGTKVHISSLHQFGPSPLHRIKFVETALNKLESQISNLKS